MNKKKSSHKVSPKPVDSKTLVKYSRSQGITKKDIKKAKDKKIKGFLQKNEAKIREAVIKAAKTKLLQVDEPGYLVAEDMEKTWKFKQEDIIKNIPLSSANKIFNLKLDSGPYRLDYSRNGKYMLIGGSLGHVASFDWKSAFHHQGLGIRWLHNETLYAVAQRRHVYIYDANGLEVHSLKKHTDATRLEFLPYHLLLVSSGKTGVLRYQDISTGEMIVEMRTKMGAVTCTSHNPTNAIMHLGHTNGVVSLWSPNLATPLVKMLCHRGAIHSVSVDRSGMYMVTSGLDGQLKVWDIRNYKVLQEYYTPLAATSVNISQMGLLSVTFGSTVNIWKDAFCTKQKSPYLTHIVQGSVVHMATFCPFDDTLGIGHAQGIASILAPGSGEPNFDSFEANPFQTKRQRQESEVKGLLNKIPADTIALDTSYIGKLREGQRYGIGGAGNSNSLHQ